MAPAPTQSEPPFLAAQGAVLVLFLLVGALALVRFRPDGLTAAQSARGEPSSLPSPYPNDSAARARPNTNPAPAAVAALSTLPKSSIDCASIRPCAA